MKIKVYTQKNGRSKIKSSDQDFEIVNQREIKEIAKNYKINEIRTDSEYVYCFYERNRRKKYIAIGVFDFDDVIFNIIEEKSKMFNQKYNLGFDYLDVFDDINYCTSEFNYNALEKWEEIFNNLNESDLLNFYTNLGRDSKTYSKENAIQELQDLIENTFNNAYNEALKQEKEYYSFY